MTTGPTLRPMEIGGRTFEWGTRTFVMGIINVSPESFSGDGIAEPSAAIRQGLAFVEQGADILDVGGQSTRPIYSATVEASVRGGGSGTQYEELDSEQELRRVIEVIRGLTAATDVPISIDTYKPPVAQGALNAGAVMINDIWGLKHDPSLAGVAAKAGVPLVLMHNQEGTSYVDLIPDIVASLRTSIGRARSGGVGEEKIIVDPGFGFGKTVAGNLEVIRRLPELRELGRPILLGSSRKSTIGRILDEPADHRVEGTAATVAIGIQNGVDIVRVHDVAQMAKVVRMADAVVRGLISEG
ncbi:MAG: dihydropteroate synthase [Dehalococcoidia bacterium]|nr:dihydropteroate synthase [Dehalococcoidia bacterium]